MLFLSSIITMGLWGAGTVQLYYYYDKYVNDGLFLRLYVLAIWLLDTIHQALIIATAYYYFVTHYSDPSYLKKLDVTIPWSVVCSSFVCIMVQAMFVRRIWYLSYKKVVLCAVLILLIVAQFVTQMVYFGLSVHFALFSGLGDIIYLTRTINVITMVADGAIAGVLVFLLQRSRTGFKGSESIINRLIVFVINTGLTTGISAVMVLVMSLVLPSTLIYMFFYFNITRLYVNSLLAMLNYRKTLRGSLEDSTEPEFNTISMGRFRGVDLETGSHMVILFTLSKNVAFDVCPFPRV
ncbi:hypothetical protein DFH11DRAFT_310110 [Phellopilus nigrolimitatus]|nr:hypothetical protein DFH11DRAFT_310110 [Phellopilus nigrolimitatus]